MFFHLASSVFFVSVCFFQIPSLCFFKLFPCLFIFFPYFSRICSSFFVYFHFFVHFPSLFAICRLFSAYFSLFQVVAASVCLFSHCLMCDFQSTFYRPNNNNRRNSSSIIINIGPKRTPHPDQSRADVQHCMVKIAYCTQCRSYIIPFELNSIIICDFLWQRICICMQKVMCFEGDLKREIETFLDAERERETRRAKLTWWSVGGKFNARCVI